MLDEHMLRVEGITLGAGETFGRGAARGTGTTFTGSSGSGARLGAERLFRGGAVLEVGTGAGLALFPVFEAAGRPGLRLTASTELVERADERPEAYETLGV